MDISACPVPGVSLQTVEHLYLNQVRPLALSRQFELVLHGSAVESENTAIAFLGHSGRGKSTLAASFATTGARFLSDDSLHIDRVDKRYFVRPGHPSIRLWKDSCETLIPKEAELAPPADYTTKARFRGGPKKSDSAISGFPA